jgi:hypothetical protein
VPTKNPFSFDRSDIAVVAPKETLPVGPKPLLFGIMSIGNESIAMLSPAQSGTRQSRAMKVGESMDNWELVEIQKDSVIMTAAGARATVILNDPAARTARELSRTGTSTTPAQSVIVNAPVDAPAQPAAASLPPPPPPPSSQPGQGKGHWMYTPFGNTWVPDTK